MAIADLVPPFEFYSRILGPLGGRRALLQRLGPDADDPVARLARGLPASYLGATPPERIVEELGRLARLPPGGVFATARWPPGTSTLTVTVGQSW